MVEHLDYEELAKENPEVEERWLSFSVLLQLTVLVIATLLAYLLKRWRIHYIHEAGAALLLGVFVGGIVEFSNTSQTFREHVNFSEDVFFLFLLPPIIFESGYNMEHTKQFFGNFGAICMFAFLGTAVSTMVIGLVVYMASYLNICYPFSLLESLIFGSLISATDPVTVLAIFQELGVQSDLYCLVFGESVLNDAVAIVLFRTLSTFTTEPATAGSLGAALGTFLIIFLGSVAIGMVVALLASLLFKYTHFKTDQDLHSMETCLVVIFPYCAYTCAEGLELSGIVAILFCGITMATYMRPNLSPFSQAATMTIFKTLAKLAESFIFIYMGVAAFLSEQKWDAIPFLLVAILAMLAGRAANVYPNTFLINLNRVPEQKIPANQAFMMNVSGLRGAIAFALALNSSAVIGEEAGKPILTCTLIIVVLTVLVIGGSTSTLIDKLQLREGHRHVLLGSMEDQEQAEEGDSAPSNAGSATQPIPEINTRPLFLYAQNVESSRNSVISTGGVGGILEKLKEVSESSFEHVNGTYIKPIFHRKDCEHIEGLELVDLRVTSSSDTPVPQILPPPILKNA
mmetsp:Transcript_13451/g.18406  ORF Transcript_13451/g.18406 Transcript_13451/m.18406 type:complete len:571 (+) Transcript_13451:74-1786(+)